MIVKTTNDKDSVWNHVYIAFRRIYQDTNIITFTTTLTSIVTPAPQNPAPARADKPDNQYLHQSGEYMTMKVLIIFVI